MVVLLAVAAYIVVRDLVQLRMDLVRVVDGRVVERILRGHDSGYWHSHMRQYLAFYARHCA